MQGFNLILINIDALRADHLGCYGYSRETSPFIDRLASEGVLFEEALSNSSFTRESVSALMSGRLPTSGRSIGWEASPALAEPTLAEMLREAGYRTGFFSNSLMLTSRLFTRGFEVFEHLPDSWGISRAGPELSARASEFISAHAEEPFLLYLHYLDPHGPYHPPKENYLEFRQPVFPNPVPLYGHVRRNHQRLVEKGFGPGDPRFEDMVTRYDAEILHSDHSLEMLFSTLKKLGLQGRTLVVVTADHGEEFHEHGFVEHSWTLYRESLHVPLIFWAPRALGPTRVSYRVSTVDLLPTLLTLLEVPGESRDYDGRSLFQRTGEGIRPRGTGEPVIAELMIRERSMLRTVVDGDWKYIAAYRWLEPEDRPRAVMTEKQARERMAGRPLERWGPVVREELYRLSDDPEERDDVSDRHPDELQEMRSELDAYRNHCEREVSEHPMAGAGELPLPLSPELEARLRALGYL